MTVATPGLTEDSTVAIIIRGEVTGKDGWLVHHPEEGPLYGFATAEEVAEFLWSGGCG